jgi:hypothetical protein
MRVPMRTPPVAYKTKSQTFISGAANVLAVAIGIGTEFTVHFVGELYLSEILLLIVFPILIILRGKKAMRPELKTVYLLMGLWLMGLIVADVYNHIDIYDRLRGMAMIVFFAINLLCMTIVLGRSEKRTILFLVGLTVGELLSVKLQPSPAFADYPWKFGYSYGVIQATVLLSSYFYMRRRYLPAALLILGVCLVNLVLNYRGPVLGLLLTMVLVFPIIPDRIAGARLVPESRIVRLLILAFLTVVAAEGANMLVDFVTEAGYVSDQAQAKNEAQSKMGLLGGRPELAVGLRAAMDSPIIGHGSWAKDFKYLEMLEDLEVESGVFETTGDFEAGANGLIPGHSQIVTAWIWAGVTGLVFWLYMAWFILKGILRLAIFRPPMAPAYMALLIGVFWDIFFSPFAANRRIIDAVAIVLVIDQHAVLLKPVMQPIQRIRNTMRLNSFSR